MSFPPTGVRRRALARPLTRLTRRPHPCDNESREQAILRCIDNRDWGVLDVKELESLESWLDLSSETRGTRLHKRVCEALGKSAPEPDWADYL